MPRSGRQRIRRERIVHLNTMRPRDGAYVLYWMQASQRARWNHALEHAVDLADGLKLPVVVGFGLTGAFPDANARHYRFMLEGLVQTAAELRKRGIAFVLRTGRPDRVAIGLSAEAAICVVDRGYLSVHRDWRSNAAARMACPLIEVESDVVVPVDVASGKEEYAARTIRPKLTRLLDEYLTPLRSRAPKRDAGGLRLDGQSPDDPGSLLQTLRLGRSVRPVSWITGGRSACMSRLSRFLAHDLQRFHTDRNDPSSAVKSFMSPYLHFGQVSPLEIALKALKRPGPGTDAFLEELIVRRELSMNFVRRNPAYDSYDALPDWARRTLSRHESDPRPVIYTPSQLEHATTHDPYWNAAQREMTHLGMMAGYMRMYWGKKIIEWTRTPREAFDIALSLNNRYELDGRDPNGFAGVAWCFGKHDRPWGERPVFGTVRYMTDGGLKRKFDVDRYVEHVEKRIADEQAGT